MIQSVHSFEELFSKLKEEPLKTSPYWQLKHGDTTIETNIYIADRDLQYVNTDNSGVTHMKITNKPSFPKQYFMVLPDVAFTRASRDNKEVAGSHVTDTFVQDAVREFEEQTAKRIAFSNDNYFVRAGHADLHCVHTLDIFKPTGHVSVGINREMIYQAQRMIPNTEAREQAIEYITANLSE